MSDKETQGITVLLVDDHEVVRTGYQLLLSRSDKISEIIEAGSGEIAYDLYNQFRPDVVIMDISLPGVSGITTTNKIMAKYSDAKILIFSMHDEPVYVSRALDAGALGYVSKSSAGELLVQAVCDVAEGTQFLSAEFASDAEGSDAAGQDIFSVLSPREFDVFYLIAKGYTVREISDHLCLSTKTIANYSTIIKSKLHIKTSAEITRLAYEHGVFSAQS